MTSQAISASTPGITSRGQAWKAAPVRPFWNDALHIFAIFNVAIAYPLLHTMGQDAWYFIVERAKPIDVFLLPLFLCVIVPGILVGIEWLTSLFGERVRNLVHTLVLSLVLIAGAFFTLPRMFNGIEVSTIGFVSIPLGVTVTMLYLRLEPIQLFCTFLAVGIIVVPAKFLFFSEASKIAFPDEVEATGSPVEIESDTPIVMVVFDEFPLVSLLDENHEIDAHRYPNFAELADDGYWFRNATTVSDETRLALPAILTGTYGEFDSLPREADYPDNLFTLLSKSHRLRVFESVTHLCSDQYCDDAALTVYERADFLLRGMQGDNVRRAISNTDRSSRYLDFVESINQERTPRLYFHHNPLPHSPWLRLSSGALYSPDTSQPRERFSNEWIATHNYQRHLLQVQYTDHLVGELRDHLIEEGIYDETLVIVAGDHGASFTTDLQYRVISESNSADIIPVPLFVKFPYQEEGVVSDRNVQLIDILPTIADAMEFDIPWETDGRSMIDDSVPESDEKVVLDREAGVRRVYGPVIEGVDDAVRRKVALFGTGDDPDGIYEIGRYSDLVGKDVEQLEVSGSSEFKANLDYPTRYESVNLDSEFIPALIEGHVGSPPATRPDAPIHLALAVNGTVRATTQTYEEGNALKFAAMVPEESFVDGENRIEILVVSGPEDDPEIRRLAQ